MFISVLALLAATSFGSPVGSQSQTLNHPAILTRDSGSCDGKFGDDPTSTYGDYTGCTSQYDDGSGTYVRSDDVYYYDGGDKCWTDLVSITYPYTRVGSHLM